MRVRSVFISDVHLGHRGSRANELLAFLAEVEARNIFVIGDLVDFWALVISLRPPSLLPSSLSLILYCNDGDWVETCSSLVESANGKLALVYWSEIQSRVRASSRSELEPIRNVVRVAQSAPQIRSASSR